MSLVGNLADLPLTDIFQIVSLSKRTGVLALSRGDEKAAITFLHGNVIKATSNQNRRTLGAFLKEKGLITDKEEAHAIAAQRQTGEPFGTVLVRLDMVPRDKMETAIREHIQAMIMDLLTWEDGHFEFELVTSAEEVLPPKGARLVLEEGVETQHLIIEGLRILDERRHAQSEAPDPTLKEIGFSSLMEEEPVSVSEPAAPPSQDLGHPEGMWESLQEEIQAPEPPPPPPAAGFLEELVREVSEEWELQPDAPEADDGLAGLRSMVEELKAPSSLSEVLLLILRYASEFLGRGALFVVRHNEIRGFGQFGLSGHDPLANDRIRNTCLPLDREHLLSEAARRRTKVQRRLDLTNAWERYLQENLQGSPATEAVVLPVANNNRTVALLYGDNGPDGPPVGEIQTLEIFILQAGFVLDRFFLRERLQQAPGAPGPAAAGRDRRETP